MGVKYVLLTIILILIGIISVILIIPAQAQNSYKTIYLREFSFKDYEMTYKFENNPTRSGTADDRYTDSIYRRFEKINDAIENTDKKKDWHKRFPKSYKEKCDKKKCRRGDLNSRP